VARRPWLRDVRQVPPLRHQHPVVDLLHERIIEDDAEPLPDELLHSRFGSSIGR
jgi:hypothetical protein